MDNKHMSPMLARGGEVMNPKLQQSRLAKGGSVTQSTHISDMEDEDDHKTAMEMIDEEHSQDLPEGDSGYTSKKGSGDASLEKRYAFGGATESTPSTDVSCYEDKDDNTAMRRMLDEEHSREALADGGEVGDGDTGEAVTLAREIIRARRQRAAMADGGTVDLERNSEEDLNNEDQMSFRAGMKEQYDDRQISRQPANSNLKRDDIDSDEHDMVGSIRKKMKRKAYGGGM
jgi:hypothetical protein